MKKFGEILVSRPAGREAFQAASAYLFSSVPKDGVELDFEGVKVLAPSWADEFLTGLMSKFPKQVRILPSKNASVLESLKTLDLTALITK